jgi:hypothetical protein
MSHLMALVSRPREMGGKVSSRRVQYPPPRFSRPRAPISPSLLARMWGHVQLNPGHYKLVGDVLLYVGVLAVFVIAAYLLLRGQ